MSETEILDIYDEDMNFLGKATREEAHQKGLWHSTFQCWLINNKNSEKEIIFQKRQENKLTFPNYYDITAAGHLVSGEKLEDGLRELEEELGVKISFEQLIPIGIIKQQFKSTDYIDNEFCNVFLSICNQPFSEYRLQKEEVKSLISIKMSEFEDLINERLEKIIVKGIELNDKNQLECTEIVERLQDFVPHGYEYYSKVIKNIKNLY